MGVSPPQIMSSGPTTPAMTIQESGGNGPDGRRHLIPPGTGILHLYAGMPPAVSKGRVGQGCSGTSEPWCLRQPPRAAETTCLASSWTWARWSAPLKDSA